MPAEAVAGLFEPFRRLARDRIDQAAAPGLGLAIARSITQAHDGIIAARPAEHGGLRVDVQLQCDLTLRHLPGGPAYRWIPPVVCRVSAWACWSSSP